MPSLLCLLLERHTPPQAQGVLSPQGQGIATRGRYQSEVIQESVGEEEQRGSGGSVDHAGRLQILSLFFFLFFFFSFFFLVFILNFFLINGVNVDFVFLGLKRDYKSLTYC